MGTWLGHAAPGSFFIGLGFWWLIKVFQEYGKLRDNYVNTLTKRCCMCGRLRKSGLEPLIIILLAVMGIAAEVITGMMAPSWPQSNSQHSTMYFAFGLTAVVDLLQHNDVKFIPKGSEYMCYILALVVELILFRFHLHDREEVDIHIHMLLVYTIAANTAAVAAEFYFPRSIHAGLARSFFTLLQGTWFVQIAFTLYNPVPGSIKWDLSDMENKMIITTIYAWHIIGSTLGVMVVGACTIWCCSQKCSSDQQDIRMSLLPTDDNGEKQYTGYMTEEDEDAQWTSGKQSHETV